MDCEFIQRITYTKYSTCRNSVQDMIRFSTILVAVNLDPAPGADFSLLCMEAHMKWFFPAVLSAIAFVSCYSPVRENVRKSVKLHFPDPVTGEHCESSAILNALVYLGYTVSEHEITGGGGALSFLFMKDTFPFIAARNMDLKERFFEAAGLSWTMVTPDGRDAGWSTIIDILDRGFPVVLRVDMRFLPYRYGGKTGPRYMSFGAHYITLFAVNHETGIALVTDTEFSGLQTIALSDLHRARTSTTKNFPPHGEFYWIGDSPKPGDGKSRLDSESLIRASLATVIENYETGALENLSRFPEDLATFEDWSGKTFLHPAILSYMATNIEDNGTGGASFRELYRKFLENIVRSTSFGKKIEPLIPLCENAVNEWHRLSDTCRELSGRIKGMSAQERSVAFSSLAEIARGIYDQEKALYRGMKSLVEKGL